MSNLAASSPFRMAARTRLRIDSDLKAHKMNQPLMPESQMCFGDLTEDQHCSNITPLR